MSAWILNFILDKEFQEPEKDKSIAENFVNMAFPELSKEQKEM